MLARLSQRVDSTVTSALNQVLKVMRIERLELIVVPFGLVA
jgi:hypothetical protein